MSYAQRHSVAITVAADGSATAYLPLEGSFTGTVSQMRYVKNNFADGVDFTITSEATGETIWSEANVNASATRAPRQATHATDGTASLYAATGEPVEAPIALANDRIKIVIANGGVSTSGTFYAILT